MCTWYSTPCIGASLMARMERFTAASMASTSFWYAALSNTVAALCVLLYWASSFRCTKAAG